MNPKDWIKTKEEMDAIKKSNNEYHVSKLKRPEKTKVNTEIVPLKPVKKDYMKLVKTEEKGGPIKKQFGGVTTSGKPKTVEIGKEQSTIKNYVKTSKCGGKATTAKPKLVSKTKK